MSSAFRGVSENDILNKLLVQFKTNCDHSFEVIGVRKCLRIVLCNHLDPVDLFNYEPILMNFSENILLPPG